MIRNLKALGLALVAVFALSAVGASAVAAQQAIFTSDGPVTLTGTENAGTLNAVTGFGITAKCPESTGTGHKYNATPHTVISDIEGTFTLTPHIKQVGSNGHANCRATPGNFPATTDFNGCDYVTHLGQTTGEGDTYGGTLDLVCPPGNEVMWTVWTTDHEHTTSMTPFCLFRIPPQVGLAGAHLTDTTNGTVDVNGTIEGIKATRVNNTGIDTHTVLCPESTTTVGKLDINVTVKGINAAGGSTLIGISE
jgi:hypothetical protein